MLNVHRYACILQDVSFITAPSMTGLSHRTPGSDRKLRDKCGVQDSDKRNTLHAFHRRLICRRNNRNAHNFGRYLQKKKTIWRSKGRSEDNI